MWKTLYAIGLALPRILFRPLREFKLVIPDSGSPFVMGKKVVAAEYIMIEQAMAEMVRVKSELEALQDMLRKGSGADAVAHCLRVSTYAIRRYLEVLESARPPGESKLSEVKEGEAEE